MKRRIFIIFIGSIITIATRVFIDYFKTNEFAVPDRDNIIIAILIAIVVSFTVKSPKRQPKKKD